MIKLFLVLDYFPLFLHFLTSLLKFILWLKLFHRQKAGRGHGGGWGRRGEDHTVLLHFMANENFANLEMGRLSLMNCVDSMKSYKGPYKKVAFESEKMLSWKRDRAMQVKERGHKPGNVAASRRWKTQRNRFSSRTSKNMQSC